MPGCSTSSNMGLAGEQRSSFSTSSMNVQYGPQDTSWPSHMVRISSSVPALLPQVDAKNLLAVGERFRQSRRLDQVLPLAQGQSHNHDPPPLLGREVAAEGAV